MQQPHSPSDAGAPAGAYGLGAGPWAALVAALGAVTAAATLTLVKPHEGTVMVGYLDPARIVTACTGHTRTAVLGRRYTRAECDWLLVRDLVDHNRSLACITHPLAPHERAALLSFVFNVGPGVPGKKDGLCVLRSGRPSTLRVKANAGDMAGACAELTKWTGMAGRDCAQPEHRRLCGGLVTRRAAERAMCEGTYGTDVQPMQGATA